MPRRYVSIPYSTIKISDRRTGQSATSVSIPYSTIKIIVRGAYLKAALGFQFLIVRLKLSMFATYARSYPVSIPYSTIKIPAQQGAKRAFSHVSIPYSTIKIACIRLVQNRLSSFQFLIVRLKSLMSPYIITGFQCFNSL